MTERQDQKSVTRAYYGLARVYTTIGRLALEVPTVQLMSSSATELMSAQVDVEDICPDLAGAVRLLCESVTDHLPQIRSEYVILFSGVKKLAAPPWESCYLSGKRQVCTSITEDVRLAYLEACVSQELTEPQPDDHIGLELQFLGSLYHRLAEMDPAADEATEIDHLRQRFVSDHLGRWAMCFCDDLEKAAETEFYRLLAQVIRLLAKMEMGVEPCSD